MSDAYSWEVAVRYVPWRPYKQDYISVSLSNSGESFHSTDGLLRFHDRDFVWASTNWQLI